MHLATLSPGPGAGFRAYGYSDYRYIQIQIFIDSLAAPKPNSLIKRERVLKTSKQHTDTYTHNKPMVQREGLSLLVVTGWYLVMV